MKKLMTIAAGVLLSGSVFANTITVHNNTKLSTEAYSSKAEAINAGYDIAEQLANSGQSALRQELRLFPSSFARNIEVAKTEITTEEFARSRDQLQYRAIVNVNYHFDTKDND